jgi:hypothetical protein
MHERDDEMGEMAGEEVDREAAIEALLSLLDIGLPPNDDTLLASEVRDDTHRIPHITLHALLLVLLPLYSYCDHASPLSVPHTVCTYKRLTLHHTID